MAVNGTKYISMACVHHKVKKLVITSSIYAVQYTKEKKKFYNSNDFTDPETSPAYPRSKVLAEQIAWKIAKKYKLNVSSINPGWIMGKFFTKKWVAIMSTTLFPFKSYAYADFTINPIHVEDVALAHVRCL